MHIKHTKNHSKDIDLNFTLESSLAGPVLKTLHSVQWWDPVPGKEDEDPACLPYEAQPKNGKKKRSFKNKKCEI